MDRTARGCKKMQKLPSAAPRSARKLPSASSGTVQSLNPLLTKSSASCGALPLTVMTPSTLIAPSSMWMAAVWAFLTSVLPLVAITLLSSDLRITAS